MPTAARCLGVLCFALALGAISAGSRADEPWATVDAARLQSLIDRGVPVVDLRTPGEWRDTGVIAGSRRITAFTPDGRFHADFAREFQAVAGRGDEVALICWSGARSRAVAEALSRQAGYSRVYDVAGGIARWLDEGRPVDACERC